MKLYDNVHAPNGRRVRIFLAEKGIEVPSVQIDLAAKEQLGEAYRSRNPAGLLPALELDDGTVIGESIAICRYFEATHPGAPHLFGDDAVSRARVEMWNRRVEHDGLLAVQTFVRNTHPLFAGHALAGPDGAEQSEEIGLRGRHQAEHLADWLDRELAERPFIAGASFSVADITWLVAVDFARIGKLRLRDGRDHLERWYGEVSSRPSVTA